MYTKFATITLNADRRGQNPVSVFVAQPTPTQENLAGRLFILIDVNAKKSDAQKIINFIIDDINENYYQNEKIVLREKIDALKIENIFETVLVKTNKNLLDFLVQEKIQITPANINATIGIVYENQLHFANIGKNKALLLYKEEAGDSEYRLINVERSAAANEEPNLKKLFSSIISGDMPNKSYFIFANEALAEYLFNKDLIEIITKLAPLGAAEQIKNTLARINTFIPFIGIIIKNNTNTLEDPDYQPVPPPDYGRDYQSPLYSPHSPRTPLGASQPNNSPVANNLTSVEQKTEQILLSGPIVSRRQVSHWFGKFLKKLNPFPPIGRLIKAIFRHRDSADALPLPVSGPDKNIISGEKSRRPIAKILTIVLVICVLLLAGGIIYQKMQNNRTAVVEKTKSLGDLITQKESQVEASLMYDPNCSSAASNCPAYFKDLQDVFARLTDDDKKTIDGYNSLLAKFNSYTDQIQKVTKVDNLTEIADIAKVVSDAQPQNIEIGGTGNNRAIYAADNNKKQIYKINLAQKAIEPILTSDKIAATLDYPIIDKKSGLIYYLDNKQIIQLDPKTDSWNAVKFNYGDGQDLLGIALYDDKLYALDKNSNQLYRYALVNNAYDKGEARLKDKLDASNIISFAIDPTVAVSPVYFLKSTGEVDKFNAGLAQGFKLDTVDPAFKNATKISVLKNIYILEPDDKRLAVFSKNGKFLKQYESDKLTNLKDFFIDESAGQAYFLNDAAIYEMPL